MKLVFINARIVDPEADSVSLGGVVVADGVIAGRFGGNEHPSDSEVVDCGKKFLAPGIVDIGVKIGEPGERHKESFRTAGIAAAAGGITTMVTRPDTIPPIDNPETLEFFLRRARTASKVKIHPMATLTKGRKGQEISEIGLLSQAGAAAFSDCDIPVRNAGTMRQCMAYAKQFSSLGRRPSSGAGPVGQRCRHFRHLCIHEGLAIGSADSREDWIGARFGIGRAHRRSLPRRSSHRIGFCPGA